MGGDSFWGGIQLFFGLLHQVSGGGFEGFADLPQNRARLLGDFVGGLGGILAQMLYPFTLEQFLGLVLQTLGGFSNLLGGILRQFFDLLRRGTAGHVLDFGLGFLPKIGGGVAHGGGGLGYY